jgi:hypothetical protein
MPHAHCLEPCALRPTPGLLIEFPISTNRLFGLNLPFSGGGFFRLFPYWLTKWGFKNWNGNNLKQVIFYIHPWEFDPEIPGIDKASRLSKLRTHANLKNTEKKFRKLLSDFRFVPLNNLIKRMNVDN